MMDLNEVPSDHHTVNKVEILEGMVEEKCLAIELEIQKKVMDLDGVRDRIRVLESEKAGMEGEIEGLKRKKKDVEGEGEGEVEVSFGDWGVEGDYDEVSKVDELMIENKVLECEKASALKGVEVWKEKCKELELRVVELERGLSGRSAASMVNGMEKGGKTEEVVVQGTPCSETPQNRYLTVEDSQGGTVWRGASARRRLQFQNDTSGDMKFSPCTPAGARPSFGVVMDIFDSDEEHDDAVTDNHNPTLSSKGSQKRKRGHKVVTSDDDCDKEKPAPKRRILKSDDIDDGSEENDNDTLSKRSCIRVSVDPMGDNHDHADENEDEDDNIPISHLMLNNAQDSSQSAGLHTGSYTGPCTRSRTRRRRHLVKKRGKAQENVSSPGILKQEDVEDDDSEAEDGSGSDAGSLGSFIVSDSDVEKVEDSVSEEEGVDDVSEEDADNVSENDADNVSDEDEHGPYPHDEPSDNDLDFPEIIAKLQRRKEHNLKWKSEVDMLSDFGKDPLLCMRAVCAIYRRQISKEMSYLEGDVLHGQGFNKYDADRGTLLGDFLTGGKSNEDLAKSVKELEEFDPNGVEVCEKLAKRYSKQLFEIYETGEDRFFPESRAIKAMSASCSDSVSASSSETP